MKVKTVDAILRWIEEHLHSHISVEDVVVHTGYSRRHIHNIFKYYVGMGVGQYIRRRKLCHGALFLRLSARSVTDIALYLDFSSSQSFCREFKKLFGVSPRHYRCNEDWDLSFLQAPFAFDDRELPPVELCELPVETYYGYSVSYNESFVGKPMNSNPLRFQLVSRNLNQLQSDVTLLTDFKPASNSVEHLNVTTFIGSSKIQGEQWRMNSSYHIKGGLYAKFSFIGTWDEYANLSRRLYLEVLPAHRLKRRAGVDIERFSFNESDGEPHVFTCDYYIPVTH